MNNYQRLEASIKGPKQTAAYYNFFNGGYKMS